MTLGASFHPDPALVLLARDVLAQAGYHHRQISENGETVLLAENRYLIMGLAATATISDFAAAESALTAIIQNEISSSRVELGRKSWELYLVLMTQEKLGEQTTDTQTLFEIGYDSSRFRRIVRVGVIATERAVRRALSMFLDLPESDTGGFPADPLSALSAMLVEQGFDKEIADRVVNIYRNEEDLTGAI